MIEFTSVDFFLGLAILAIILIFLAMQKRSLWYLVFFSLFWIYLLVIVSVIVFPIVPLPRDVPFRPSLNLIPFYFGRCDMPELCFRLAIDNILLTMPFGFGISFIVHLRPKDFAWLPILVGLALEGTQLIVSLLSRSPFRSVDINDVILNAAGVWLGYFLFRIFGYLYLYITRRFEVRHKFVFVYIYDVIRRSTDH